MTRPDPLNGYTHPRCPRCQRPVLADDRPIVADGDVVDLSNELGAVLSRMVARGVEIPPSVLALFQRLAAARLERAA